MNCNQFNTGFLMQNTNNLFSLFAIMVLIIPLTSEDMCAQPYLDIVNIKYTNSPNAGLIYTHKNDLHMQYFGISTNLPLQIKNKSGALILSPFFEKWVAQINNKNQKTYHSISLPVSFSNKITGTRWNILVTAIVRMNDSIISRKGKIQIGGAFILNNKRNENFKWKTGLYINNELFGLICNATDWPGLENK